jgi:hypothetical protein
MKILKFVVKSCLCLPILLVLVLNVRLFYKPTWENIGHSKINTGHLAHLNHLKNILHHENVASEMQMLFPEGFVFTNVLYGLAWADAAVTFDPNGDLYKRALTEIKWSLAQIDSKEGRFIANASLPLPDGAFYKGWSTYLMGKYLALLKNNFQDNIIQNQFITNCQSIDSAILKSTLPFLESYPSGTWPADNVLCLASLALHDKIYPPQYQSTISAWLTRIKAHLDPKTGLILHDYNAQNPQFSSGARGSSQSLMLSFLPSIDSSFSENQFEKFKKHFVEYKLGLPAIREYPKGENYEGDVDSGPVIWGVGASASVVATRAMLENQDNKLYEPIRNCIEAFGFHYTWNSNKVYLGGYLPVAEAFIAWTQAKDYAAPQNTEGGWRTIFQLISLVGVLLFGWWIWRL